MQPLDHNDKNQCQQCGEKLSRTEKFFLFFGINRHKCKEQPASEVVASDPEGFDPLGLNYCPDCARNGITVELYRETGKGIVCDHCPKCDYEVCAT